MIFSPLLIWFPSLSVLFPASFLPAPVAWLHYFARTRFIVKQFQLFSADHAKLGPQGETIQAHDVADVGKGRLRDGYPHAVQDSACGRVDLSLHLFDESFFSLGGPAMEVGHLPDFRPLGMPQRVDRVRTSSYKF